MHIHIVKWSILTITITFSCKGEAITTLLTYEYKTDQKQLVINGKTATVFLKAETIFSLSKSLLLIDVAATVCFSLLTLLLPVSNYLPHLHQFVTPVSN